MANPAQTVKRYRGRHVFETLAARKFEGNIGSAGAGNTFYVDLAGSNGNNGRYASNPLKTLAAALAKCSSDHDDYIIVMDCYSEDTEPIDIEVNRVHLLGLDVGNGKYPRLEASENTSILDIDAEYFEIAGFSFGGGASRGAIRWQASKGRGIIHHCWFGHTGASAYGIEIPASYDAVEMLIEDCIFGVGLTADGIFINHNATRTIIQHNLFRRLGGLGINVPAGKSFAEGSILDNTFAVKDAQTGEAITIASTAENHILVTGNRAMNGMLNAGYTFNPFRDLGTNTYNDWGLNYRGNQVIEPVGA